MGMAFLTQVDYKGVNIRFISGFLYSSAFYYNYTKTRDIAKRLSVYSKIKFQNDYADFVVSPSSNNTTSFS